TPYSAIIHALDEFARLILMQSGEKVSSWRDTLRNSLQSNLKIITDIVPKIEGITGKADALTELDPTSSKNRFESTIVDFFISIGKENIVLFLDDLQWADAASLRLIELVCKDPRNSNLHIISAYRENEVDASHPFQLALNSIEKSNLVIPKIQLKELTIEDTNMLLIDTLGKDDNDVKALNELIYNKTAGNPFFIRLFLFDLYSKKILHKNPMNNEWEWEIHKIQSLELASNVAELAVQKLKIFSEEFRNTISTASIIGYEFSLDDLVQVTGYKPDIIRSVLKQALVENFIFEISELHYKFQHDKIREASLSLLSQEEISKNQFKIAKVLLEKHSQESWEENCFTILEFLNPTINLFFDEKESIIDRKDIAVLNRTAGLKARKSGAFKEAIKYFHICKSIKTEWETEYLFNIKFYSEYMEAAFLSGNTTLMDEISKEIFSHYKDTLDLVPAYEIKINQLSQANQMDQAVKTACIFLKELGVVFPDNPKLLHVFPALFKTKIAIRGRSIEELAKIPACQDKKILSIMRIIVSAGSAAYFSSPEMLTLFMLKGTELSVKWGNSSYASYFYGGYGLILAGALGDFKSGIDMAKLTLDIVARYNAKALECKSIFLVNAFLKHWQKDYPDIMMGHLEGYRSGIESGDLEYATGNLLFYNLNQVVKGSDFKETEKEIKAYSSRMLQINQNRNENSNRVLHQFSLALTQPGENGAVELTGEIIDKEAYVQKALEEKDLMAYIWFQIFQAILYYRNDEFENAYKSILKVEKQIDGIISQLLIPVAVFYGALIRLSLNREFGKVKAAAKKLKKWSSFNPTTQTHRYLFIDALIKIKKNKNLEVMLSLEKALDLAVTNGYLFDAALIAEKSGDYYLNIGRNVVGNFFIRQSAFRLEQCGAKSQFNRLFNKYPNSGIYITSQNTVSTDQSIDMESVFRMTETISKEIKLENLLNNLLKIMIENAGAQIGRLIIKQNDNFKIIAEASVKSGLVSKVMNESIYSDYVPINLINLAIHSKSIVTIGDAMNDIKWKNDPYFKKNKTKSSLCLPLLNQGKLNGLIYLENNLMNKAFSEERQNILKMVSTQASISLENSRLYTDLVNLNRDLEEKVKIRTKELNKSLNLIQKDLNYSKRIQTSILPKIHNDTKFKAGVLYNPMDEVGGDIYDFFQPNKDKNKYRIMLADATGHGVQGALVTMAIKSEYENIKKFIRTPSELMEVLNISIINIYKTMYFSCVIIDIDLDKNILEYCSAGHPEQVIIRNSEVHTYYKTGPIIGLKADIAYSSTTIELKGKDSIFLFSDGLTEVFNDKQEEFGEERLYEILKGFKNETPDEKINAILSKLKNYRGSDKFEDDMTMIILDLE
ncbi:MAG: SpoIIE family protein phosphatase, partial [Leptospira sp.]|nr:SpoIIE family protein phosphatase [Leptospira sp.]